MSQQPIELRENRRPGEFVESQDINQIAQAINHLASRSGTSVTEPTPGVVRIDPGDAGTGSTEHVLGVGPDGELPEILTEKIAPTILLDTDGAPYFVLGRTGIDLDVDGIPYVTIGA